MKKSKLGIGILTSLLAVGALSACGEVHYAKDVILTYTRDGKTIKYTADDLLSDEFDTSSNYKEVFDNVYKIIVKNYFTEVDKDEKTFGKDQLASLKKKAQQAVDADVQSAKRKAETNGTSYDTEFSAILSEKGCEDKEELYEDYLYKYEEERFQANFYDIQKNLSILKSGTAEGAAAEFKGYFKTKVPYHVSHILVKIDDASSNNYSDAKVSETNAKRLFNTAEALSKNSYESFGEAAIYLSDDSAVKGDLGLVDTDTTEGYIEEFRYALYAYENMIGKTTEAKASTIGISDLSKYEEVNHLAEDKVSSEKFAVLPLGAFYKLQEFAEDATGYLGQKVNDGNENFYPRNIVFNHFFNRHSFALISPNKVTDALEYDTANVYPETAAAGQPVIKKINGGATGTGFHTFTKAGDGVNFEGEYLAASVKLGNKVVYRPILAVRGGTSGDSGYQGIHFIIVNRSPFEFVNGDTDASVASLENYYTTYIPDQNGYPTYKVGETTYNLQTYVTSAEESDNQSRADAVLAKLKGLDGLDHYIFKKYLADGKLEIRSFKLKNGKDLKVELFKWMDRSEELSEYEAALTRKNNWQSYLENLNMATTVQSTKAIEKACAIHFKDDHSAAGTDKNNPADPAAWNEIGGVCNDGNSHK